MPETIRYTQTASEPVYYVVKYPDKVELCSVCCIYGVKGINDFMVFG